VLLSGGLDSSAIAAIAGYHLYLYFIQQTD
jgi:asparagine synthetase B (glutamine-hydrolysing)